MRDIVATIQPDQDDIVRAGVEQTVCVQGAPGTGKTAVGLHRVAYLLYAHAQRLSRGGVLVVGPNKAFLAYIQNVLPALGELDVAQLSVADLTARVPVRGTDSDRAAQVKGDARMAQVLTNALWEQLAEPAEAIMLARGSRRWRVPAHEIAELAAELRDRGVRYGTGRDMLSHRIAHVILTRMEAAGETCDDRTHESVRRTKQVQAAVAQIWPKADPIRLVFRLLSDPDVLKRAADGVLDEAEQAADHLVQAAAGAWLGAVERGRRGAHRRGGRPDRAHAEPGAHRRRRGAGSVADAMPGHRAPVRHRLGDRARRHRAGHDAVGDQQAGSRCSATSASRRLTCACSTPATGCRGRYSTSPASCSPTSRRA